MTMVYDQPITTSLVAETCYKCGVIFGLERSHREQMLKDHSSFHCPNGHSQMYVGRTAVEIERDELKSQLARTESCLRIARNNEESERLSRRTAERSVSARKAVITRMKRRVKKGRCVCCSHEFKDLARHMKTVHPKFEPEKHVAALENRK